MKKFIVCLAAFAMVLGFTATAMAEVELYGSARFVTFWLDTDKEYIGPDATRDDEDLEWQMGKLSRFGANFKSDKISGKFEVDARAGGGSEGLGSMDIEDGTGSSQHGNIRLRHLWGAWDFGPGELSLGHRHSLWTLYVTSFGNNAGAGMAQFSGSNLRYFRASQIRLTFGNLKIAFLTPDTDYKPYNANPPITGIDELIDPTDTDTTLPRIELAYKLNLDPVTLDFVGGWQSFEVKYADGSDDVDSYLAMVKAAVNFGPVYVKGLIRYAQNGGNYGIWTAVNERAFWENGDIQDAEAYGYAASIGYKISDMITVEAAYAGTTAENDDLDGSPEDDMQAYGLLCKITPAPGVTIQPEIMVVDKMDSDYQEFFTGNDDQGEQLRIGVFWKIDFK